MKKSKTYPRHRTHPALMGCGGRDKPRTIIDGDRVMDYVGIGWIEIRKATKADRNKFPKLI